MAVKDILIIEDDKDIRETLVELLASEGYGVETAGNGQEGLQSMRTGLPRLILLDLMMPVMDGYAFLGALKENAVKDAQDVPIVVITAAGEPVRKSMGIADVLKKPVDVETLLQTVRKYCE